MSRNDPVATTGRAARRLRDLRWPAAIASIVVLGFTSCAGGGSPPDATESAPTQEIVEVPADTDSLDEASTMVAEGGMILISPGVYEEKLLVTTEDVTVRGTDRNGVILDGGGVRSYGIAATADGVRIENLTVRNTTFYGVLVTGMADENGPSAHGGDGYEKLDPEEDPPLQRFSIDHVTAYNNGLYGIYAFDAQHGSISNSYASGSADSGFYVGQCRNCDTVVAGNVAERNAIGFENANASDSLSIVGNRFSHNRVGMTLISNYQEAFVPQSGNVVVGNLISQNVEPDSPSQAEGGFGIGVGIQGGQNNLLRLNRISGHPYAGVALGSTEDLPGSGNALLENVYGDNRFDAVNQSSDRAPATGNCLDAPSLHPEGFAPECGALDPTSPPPPSDSDEPQPAEAPGEVPGPEGKSFLEVTAPPEQPDMTGDLDVVPPPLEDSAPEVSWPTEAPGDDLLIDRSGVR